MYIYIYIYTYVCRPPPNVHGGCIMALHADAIVACMQAHAPTAERFITTFTHNLYRI